MNPALALNSAFVFAAVGIDTTPLTKEQRLYLPILDEILFKLPATLENGDKLSKEEFVNSVSWGCIECLLFALQHSLFNPYLVAT